MKNFKIFKGLVRKEFLHILRDWRSLTMLLGIPIILVLLFGSVMTMEIKDANIAIVDHAKDHDSKELINLISTSEFFKLAKYLDTSEEIDKEFKKGSIRMAFVFDKDFGYKLHHEGHAQIQLIADGSKILTSPSLISYGKIIINKHIASKNPPSGAGYYIIPTVRMMYNKNLNGRYMTVPGIMSTVILLVGALMTSLSITKEKELGTLELLLSTPINRFLIMFAKIIPYLITSFISALSIIWAAKYVFEVPISGSIGLLLLNTVLYILTALALGLLISTFANSQLTAMMITMTLLMLPTEVLSGMTFPTDSLPVVLQWLGKLLPATWFNIISKGILLQGAKADSLLFETSILVIMVMVFYFWSVIRFKPRLQ